MALMGVSFAMKMVSQAMADAGLDTAAENFQKISQWMMTAGSVAMTLGMIMNIIVPMFKRAGNAGAEAGAKTAAGGAAARVAWSPFLIIFLAIAAVAAILIIAFVQLAKTSPAAKLKEANKAVDDATTAANNAKEAYDKLGESIENLGEKYKSLENLRKGTEEWNESIQEINNSVLDLIQKYPELAALIENKGGVLTLDVDSDDVQDVLNQYEAKSIAAEGAKLGAKVRASQAQLTVDFANLDALDTLQSARSAAANDQYATTQYGYGDPKRDKKVQKAVEELALAANEGAIDINDQAKVVEFLTKDQKMLQAEAAILASEFADSSDELVDFGQSTAAARAEQDAYYQAMATNAQSLIDIGAYTEDQLSQMSTVVDEDITKKFDEDEANRLKSLEKEDFEKEKEDYVKEVYGENYRVDGDKILDEAGEVVREFADSEAWIKEMAAADATLKAAELMKQVPGIIYDGMQKLISQDANGMGGYRAEVFQKALTDAESLTQNELNTYKEILADTSFTKSMWEGLSLESKKALGWTGEGGDADKKAEEAYYATLQESADTATKGFETAVENAGKLGITLVQSISASAAQGWTNNLLKFNPSSDVTEMQTLEMARIELLKDLDSQQQNEFMSLLNSIDMMDKNAWEGLAFQAKEMGITLDPTKLQNFTEAGKAASNAIEKIDFANFAEKIRDTYKLMDKVKEGERTYGEDEYKSLVSANQELKDSFIQVGEDFYYVGGSMEALTDALEKNTLENIQEANRQLGIQTEIVKAMDALRDELGPPEAMNQGQLVNYLSQMRAAAISQGGDLKEFGIPGLSNDVSFKDLDTDTLRTMATSLAKLSVTEFETAFAEGMSSANIERYTHNTSLYNAQQAANLKSEFSDEHQKALIKQAIASGGVSNAAIEAYQKAIESGDEKEILRIGTEISKSVDDIVEQNDKREAYIQLIEKVEEAIVNLRQKEIDKLSEVNDSINDANDRLISKIQEQIDADRQARDNAETEQEITDMRSRLAYLGADTSGVNALTTADLTKEVAEAEQDLQDERIDQAIANLEDANEKAAEQRERQIDLLQQQLDLDQELGVTTEKAELIVQESLNEINAGLPAAATEMGEILKKSDGPVYKTAEQQEEATNELQLLAKKAAEYFDKKDDTEDNVTGDTVSTPGSTVDQTKLNASLSSAKVALSTGDKDKYTQALEDYKTAGGDETAFKDDLYSYASDAKEKVKQAGVAQLKGSTNYKIVKEYERLTGDKSLSKNDSTFAQLEKAAHTLTNYSFSDEFSTNDWSDHQVFFNGSKITKAGDDGGNSFVMMPKGSSVWIDSQKMNAGTVPQGVYYNGDYFYYNNGSTWWQSYHKDHTEKDIGNKKQYKAKQKVFGHASSTGNNIYKYETGGLADFTGPAWLDGTKSKPEIVLNQKDSANFLVLRDILSEVLDGSTGLSKSGEKQSGDNYYDIDISVEKLEDDYDVEQLADKIRRMIYDDATYRNVNTINLIR